MSSPKILILSLGNKDALPLLSVEAARSVVWDFRDRVTALSLANRDNRAWWFSWLSSRDRYHCPLAADLAWLARAEAWLAGQSGTVTLSCPHRDLAKALAVRARRLGWRVRAPSGRPDFLVRLGDAVKMLAVGVATWFAARRHPHPGLGNHDVIMVSWADKRLLTALPRETYEDVYFGSLTRMLEQHGERPLHLAPLMCAPGQIRAVTAAAVTRGIATLGHVLGLGDVLLSVGAALCERVHWSGGDNALKRRALFRSVIYSAQARMMERAFTRLLRQNPDARLIRIYENLPWERAVDLAARRFGRPVIGYLHCAVLPSHLNYYLDPTEVPARPAPDRIVCTGSAARQVLLSLGHHDPKKVLPGMALRGPDATTLPPSRGQRPIRRILVLLEGLERMVHLLRVLEIAARDLPHLEFAVRAHPMMPLEHLAALAGVATGAEAPLKPAPPGGLETALAETDAVIYQGTTAALTAALMGVPLLWFDGALPVTDDPLFQCRDLKRGFSDTSSLAQAIAEFDGLDENAWNAGRQTVRAYAASYLQAPSPERLADFRVAPIPAVGAH